MADTTTIQPNDGSAYSGRPVTTEQTHYQQVGSAVSLMGRWVQPISLPASWTAYRAVRSQPTISLCRRIIVSQVRSQGVSLEADPDVPAEYVEFLRAQLNPLLADLIDEQVRDLIDFGSSNHEIVFQTVNTDSGLLYGVDEFKHLLPDISSVLVDWATGSFDGLMQFYVPIDARYCLHVVNDQEGSGWYGTPVLEAARETYNAWVAASTAAGTYDRNACLQFFVIKYPPGTTNVDGVETDNRQIATEMFAAIQSNGLIAVPALSEQMANMGPQWSVEVMSQEGQQSSFHDRLSYLDSLLARALGVPERAILEASQAGSRADSETHGDLFTESLARYNSRLCRDISDQVIDQLVVLNWGAEYLGKVRLVPGDGAAEAPADEDEGGEAAQPAQDTTFKPSAGSQPSVRSEATTLGVK